jgi:signal transduction histidine kinase
MNTDAILHSLDWASTSLGPRSSWPTVVVTTVDLILASPVPIVTLWNEDGIMIYNDAYSDFAGCRHPLLFGSPVRVGWPEVADFNDNVMRVGLAGGTLSYRDKELTLFRNGGAEQVWMNLDYSPIYDERRKAIGVMAIVVETSDRVKAEQALRQNEARLRFLDALGVETSRTADADRILQTTTRMTGEYLGVTSCAYADMDHDEDGFTIRGDWAAPGAAHIVGHYSLATFGALAVERLKAGLPLIINNNLTEIAPHEATVFQALGISATICMPLVKNSRLTALMAVHHKSPHEWSFHERTVIREVTERSWAHIERVRSEAEVLKSERRFREELEREVAERTEAAKRAEEALQQSRKLEALGNLTGGVAHDFNNLLSPIMGSLELLRRRMPQEPGLLKLVDNALEGAKRGATLTSRMLAFARKHEMKFETIDVGALIQGIADLLNRSLGTARVRVIIAPDLPAVEADPHQLETALLNLVVNARDAMDGQGEIEIEAQRAVIEKDTVHVKAGDYVCLSVTDTGHGMDEETLARASEPFFTTKGIGKGTGLGIPMVQGFAEQSRGTLILKSTPGEGTRAEVLLPVASPEKIASSKRASEDVSLTEHELGRMKVLVVDDDPLILMNAVDMLEELGLTVLQASSGSEALSLLGTNDLSLVITDHAMPNMTGAQLIQKISQLRPNLPIILATGYAELPETLGLKFVRLPKPYGLAELANAIAASSADS